MNDFQRGMLRAAEICDLYSDENMRMVTDTIQADPILNYENRRRIGSIAELAECKRKADQLADEAAHYASQSEAAGNIAEMIRAEAE